MKFAFYKWKFCLIPYGTTCSYKDIAVRLGDKNATRAAGGANSKNPIIIVVPCHRVVAADGTIGGYSYGEKMKRYLLNIESIRI